MECNGTNADETVPPPGVIGVGNIGRALFAHLVQHGIETTLYDRSDEVRAALRQHARLRFCGAMEGEVDIGTAVVDSVEQLLERATVIFVCIPAIQHRPMADELASALKRLHRATCAHHDRLIVLIPGQTLGAAEVYHRLAEKGLVGAEGALVHIAETLNAPFATRVEADGILNIYARKRYLPVATFPSEKTETAVAIVERYLPVVSAPAPHHANTLWTGLHDFNAVVHPAVTLSNLARIEAGDRFSFYRDGVSYGAARMIAAVDAERRAIGAAYGVETLSLLDWLHRAYGLNADDVGPALRENPAYRDISSPRDLTTRYIWEDIPTGLVPYAALARVARLQTPTIDAIIRFASVYFDHDFYAHGRTPASVGLLSRTSLSGGDEGDDVITSAAANMVEAVFDRF